MTGDAMIAAARQQSLAGLLRRSALRRPDKTALIFAGRTWSYAELDAVVTRTAKALEVRGISRGDRVALLSHNSDCFVVAYFAVARLGAISVPINFMLTGDEVAFILEHSGCRAIIVQDALVPVADHAVRAVGTLDLQVVITEAQPPPGWERMQDLMENDDGEPVEGGAGDDEPIQLMYTSGTESRPKGVMLSTRSLLAQYVSCIVDGQMSGEDVEVHALPLYHCAQLHCFLTPSIYLGATNIILPGADASSILESIERYGATKLFCPPTVWISLLRHPDFDTRDLSSLAKAYYGASIMPVPVLTEIAQRLPGMKLFNFYGQTEMAPVATVLQPEDQIRKAGSAGRAAINVETRVVDDQDNPVQAGTVGEIVHRSPHAMLGYWNAPELTAAAFRGGWLHTGDLGTLDDEGYLTIVDRKKDMIKTGGENVASREVEETMYQHPAVSEVAVFATPHPRWIEAVTAAVVLRDGYAVTEAELIEFCGTRLARFKVPKRVVVYGGLPKNASGKVLKRELRTSLSSPDSDPIATAEQPDAG
jgi:fatty-acyl-CoA synthase